MYVFPITQALPSQRWSAYGILACCTRREDAYAPNSTLGIRRLSAARAMPITVEVGLLSARTATLKAGLDEEVGALERRAQTALEVRKGRLVDSSGGVLDVSAPIKHARLEEGDSLTLHISRAQVQATQNAFATILGDASVEACWDDPVAPGPGGDTSAVQDRLKNVQQIQASEGAFAAILGDGSVVTWGDADCGGDSSAVQEHLTTVQQIQATLHAFAPLLLMDPS